MPIQDALDFIGRHTRFLITTHESADADGIGAEYALARGLAGAGKACRALNAEAVPSRWAFIDPRGLIAAAGSALTPSADEAVIVLDTCDRISAGITALDAEMLVIDHHDIVPDQARAAWLDPAASSTCEMVLELLRSLGMPLEEDMAQALLAGISFDTGNFAFHKTGPATFEAARFLTLAGASPSRVHELLNESRSLASLLLLKRAVASLEFSMDGRLARQVLLKSDFEATGALYEDAEDLINLPLRARSVELSVLFKETPEGVLRCSLRSKGAVNVAAIAQRMGGGGHKTAAGFKCRKDADATMPELESAVRAVLPAAANGGPWA